MSLSALYHGADSTELESAKATRAAPYRWLWAPLLIAATLAGSYEAQVALESPGTIIRHDLAEAGSKIAALPSPTPSERVRQAALHYFPGHQVTVDAAGFPAYVDVTLHDLDRETCRDARRLAGRIEGQVVIAIDSRTGTACGDRTAITWRIMP